MSLWRRPGCQNMLKIFDRSNATVQVASGLLKALKTMLDKTVWRSAVEGEDLKLYWKSEKRSHFSQRFYWQQKENQQGRSF